MGFEIDRRINITTILSIVVIFATLVGAWTMVQSDLNQVKKRQEVQDQFRLDVRSNYITREQMDYMVIDRLERIENNMNTRLERIEKKIDNSNE